MPIPNLILHNKKISKNFICTVVRVITMITIYQLTSQNTNMLAVSIPNSETFVYKYWDKATD